MLGIHLAVELILHDKKQAQNSVYRYVYSCLSFIQNCPTLRHLDQKTITCLKYPLNMIHHDNILLCLRHDAHKHIRENNQNCGFFAKLLEIS